jgi:hypothetical protein
MSTCQHCGAHLEPSTRFCPGCGTAVSAPAAAPATVPATMPVAATRVEDPVVPAPAASPAPSSAPASAPSHGPAVDWMQLVRGNWVGAGLVAGVTLGTAGLLALVMTALAKPADFGLDNSLTLVAAILNGSFGGDLAAHLNISGDSTRASVGAVPLTVTVISLAVGVLVFRRVTATYQRLGDAVLDAARAALLFALALMVIALVFRADSREFGRGWGNQLAHLFDARIAFGPSVAGSLLVGFVFLFGTLVASLWARRGLWPARFTGAAEYLIPPVYGLATLVLLLPVAGLVGVGLMLATGHTVQDADTTSHDFFASVSLIFGLLASGGFWLITLGAGGSLGEHGRATGSLDTSSYDHLKTFADQDPGLWAAPLVMIGVLALATHVVVRTTRSRGALQASLVAWTVTVLIASPLLVHLTSIHGRVSASEGSASGAIGVHGLPATALLTLVTLLWSGVAAWRLGVLDTTRLRELGRRIQSDPGQDAPPGSDVLER